LWALRAGLSIEKANDLEKELRSEQHRAFYRFLSEMNVWPGHFHTHLLQGNTVQAIATLVTRLDADLLVIGSVGRRGLSGLLIGNTAEKVMRQVNCSTLVIKPTGPYPNARLTTHELPGQWADGDRKRKQSSVHTSAA
jgi:nucleotide-binding universal stress UspA family protein